LCRRKPHSSVSDTSNPRAPTASPAGAALPPPAPASTSYLTEHRRRGREVLVGLLPLASTPVELCETGVAVGSERTHPELVGKRHGLAVMYFCNFDLWGTAMRGDFAEEANTIRFVPFFTAPVSEQARPRASRMRRRPRGGGRAGSPRRGARWRASVDWSAQWPRNPVSLRASSGRSRHCTVRARQRSPGTR